MIFGLRFDPTISIGTIFAVVSIIATIIATSWRFTLHMQKNHLQNQWRLRILCAALNALIIKEGGQPIDLFPDES